MIDFSQPYVKRNAFKAAITSGLIGFIWVIYEKSGWTPFRPHGISKTWGEVFDLWPRFLISVVTLFAVVFLWQLQRRDEDYYICTGCLKSFYWHQVRDGICTECSQPVETVDGFYERHPEMKD